MHNLVKDIKIDDFDYILPDTKIAKHPVNERDHSKLLLWDSEECHTHVFYEIPELLSADDHLVCNNTRVIRARLRFPKPTGASIEIFCLEPHNPSDYAVSFQTTSACEWQCLVGNSKKWKEGPLSLPLGSDGTMLKATRISSTADNMSCIIRFEWDMPDTNFADILMLLGELPIPPYLNRPTEESDQTSYQTVYSKIKGSVAAPTAGLHFTEEVLSRISSRCSGISEITLHVGAGTFQPVKSANIGGHPMHKETISVTRHTIENIILHLGHIVAVGTTSVRTLESLYYIGCQLLADNSERDIMVGQWEPYESEHTVDAKDALQAVIDYLDIHGMTELNAETRIIIVPSFRFRIVSKLITNFHQPKSTLLLLISAFVGLENWRKIYDYALDNDFRFLSYGDSSLLYPDKSTNK